MTIWWNGSNVVYRNAGDDAPFDATEATLQACCCNYEWLQCSDDSAAAIYAAADSNRPTQDYAWILVGGVYIPCYFNDMSGTAAGNPCSVEDRGGTPTQCSDVVFDWFSDTWPGTSYDVCRWATYPFSGGGTLTVSGGKIEVDVTGDNREGLESRILLTGDFVAEVDIDIQTFDNGTAVQYFEFRLTNTSNVLQAFINQNKQSSTGTDEWAMAGNPGDGTNVWIDNTTATDTRLKMTRSGSDLALHYDVGAGYVLGDSYASFGTATVEVKWFLEVSAGHTMVVDLKDFALS